MTFETLASTILYQGRILNLRRDRVRTPSGQEHDFEIIVHEPAVTILPLDADGQVWFVRQYRPATGQDLLELPAGVAEADETPSANALRELREEIGMGGELARMGGFWLAPGYSTEYMHVFIARDLYPSPLPGDEDESIQIEKIPLTQAIAMARRGEFEDSKTLIALMWAEQYLAQSKA